MRNDHECNKKKGKQQSGVMPFACAYSFSEQYEYINFKIVPATVDDTSAVFLQHSTIGRRHDSSGSRRQHQPYNAHDRTTTIATIENQLSVVLRKKSTQCALRKDTPLR